MAHREPKFFGNGLLGRALRASDTNPAVAGFGAGAAVTAGTATAFRVDTGAASNVGTIGLPAATTGWNCDVEDLTATTANAMDVRTVQRDRDALGLVAHAEAVAS